MAEDHAELKELKTAIRKEITACKDIAIIRVLHEVIMKVIYGDEGDETEFECITCPCTCGAEETNGECSCPPCEHYLAWEREMTEKEMADEPAGTEPPAPVAPSEQSYEQPLQNTVPIGKLEREMQEMTPEPQQDSAEGQPEAKKKTDDKPKKVIII